MPGLAKNTAEVPLPRLECALSAYGYGVHPRAVVTTGRTLPSITTTGGIHVNLEFFDRLYNDKEFCQTMGKVTLAAGRLESGLRTYLRLRGIRVSDQTSFGYLISQLAKHGMISTNGVRVLRGLKEQRNYLIHSVFDLLSARIEETLLPGKDLLPGDVRTYDEKAWELEQNLGGITGLVERVVSRLKEAQGRGEESDQELLFRP